MLLALLSAQRCQSIHKLRVDQMKMNGNSVTFDIDDLIKTSPPGKEVQQIDLREYPPDRRLRIKLILKTYSERTKKVRDGERKPVIFRLCKTHNDVSNDTISIWITVQITFIFIVQTRLVFGKCVCTCVTKHSNAFRTFLNWLKNSKRVWHEPKLHISRLPLFANFDLWSVSVWWV